MLLFDDSDGHQGTFYTATSAKWKVNNLGQVLIGPYSTCLYVYVYINYILRIEL